MALAVILNLIHFKDPQFDMHISISGTPNLYCKINVNVTLRVTDP